MAGLNPALQQQGLANRAAGAGGMPGLSTGSLGGYGANLAALQVRGGEQLCWSSLAAWVCVPTGAR